MHEAGSSSSSAGPGSRSFKLGPEGESSSSARPNSRSFKLGPEGEVIHSDVPPKKDRHAEDRIALDLALEESRLQDEGPTQPDGDEEIARRLQEEDERSFGSKGPAPRQGGSPFAIQASSSSSSSAAPPRTIATTSRPQPMSEPLLETSGGGYRTSLLNFYGKSVRIVLQDDFAGPCPLLALVNALALQGRLSVRPARPTPQARGPGRTTTAARITGAELSELLLSTLMEDASRLVEKSQDANVADSVARFEEASEWIPKLERGINVNLGFKGATDFSAFCPGLSPFLAFGVQLRHGWLPDPKDEKLADLVVGRSYDDLCDLVAMAGPDPDADTCRIRAFLERTLGQLTEHGLQEIYRSTNERDVAVLYRNDHFSVVHKHNDMLYVLVGDEGLQRGNTDHRFCWMTLSNTGGDEVFVDDRFGNPKAIKPEKDCCEGDDCVIL